MSEKDPNPAPAPIKEERAAAASAPDSAPPPVSSQPETLASSNSTSSSAVAAGADNRTFSQLLAGAMASPAGSPRGAPILTVTVDAVHLPVVAVPCFLAPASLLETPGFAGQFAMTHQAVLATLTAQAQMQLQAAYPSSSEALATSFPQSAPISPAPFQQRPSPVPEGKFSTPESLQPPLSYQNSQSTQIVVKTSSNDGYNWRKYGQKQVKSSDRSRSYYKCTNVSCSAKKKVERCPDGRETEIIYRGRHNHDTPQKSKSPKEKGVQSSGPSGENETLDFPCGEVNESDPSTSRTEQYSGNETPEPQLFCSSDCEGDATVKAEEEHADEPDPKRRLTETLSITPYPAPVLKTIREPKIVVQSACDAACISDGYRWRKYGQKLVKGNPNPRSYYRCTHKGCPVRKHVERASDDAKAVIITYEGKHNHDQPAGKSGSDQPPAALLIAAAATSSVTKEEELHTSDSILDKKNPNPTPTPTATNGEFAGDKALEFGGDKALESAQTLLSIGFNSSSGEEATGTNSEGINRPLFSENCAAVPVQNS